MNYTDTERYELLRRQGFSEREIEKLTKLRHDPTKQGVLDKPLDYRHLEFVRWLVATGRLTDWT